MPQRKVKKYKKGGKYLVFVENFTNYFLSSDKKVFALRNNKLKELKLTKRGNSDYAVLYDNTRKVYYNVTKAFSEYFGFLEDDEL